LMMHMDRTNYSEASNDYMNYIDDIDADELMALRIITDLMMNGCLEENDITMEYEGLSSEVKSLVIKNCPFVSNDGDIFSMVNPSKYYSIATTPLGPEILCRDFGMAYDDSVLICETIVASIVPINADATIMPITGRFETAEKNDDTRFYAITHQPIVSEIDEYECDADHDRIVNILKVNKGISREDLFRCFYGRSFNKKIWKEGSLEYKASRFLVSNGCYYLTPPVLLSGAEFKYAFISSLLCNNHNIKTIDSFCRSVAQCGFYWLDDELEDLVDRLEEDTYFVVDREDGPLHTQFYMYRNWHDHFRDYRCHDENFLHTECSNLTNLRRRRRKKATDIYLENVPKYGEFQEQYRASAEDG